MKDNQFTKKDKIFFSIILKHKKHFIDVYKKSLLYKIHINEDIMQLKTNNVIVEKDNIDYNSEIILLGFYTKENKVFKWIDQMNNIMLEHCNKYDLVELFGSVQTIIKMFNDKIITNSKYVNAIMYFIAILNPAYNLIEMSSEDNNMVLYILIKLDIVNNFNFDKFIDDMQAYKYLFIE